MHLSRRQLMAAGIGLPFTASLLNACGGGGGGGGGSSSSSSSGGGSAISSSSASTSSASSSSSVAPVFTAGSKFSAWSNTPDANFESLPGKPAPLPNGNIAVVFSTPAGEIKVQLFSAAGAKVGPEILVKSAGYSSKGDIAVLASGGFVVMWPDWDQPPAPGPRIYAQTFDASGAKVGAAYPCDALRVSDHIHGYARAVATTDNIFVGVWGRETIELQTMYATGQKIGALQTLVPVRDHDTGVFPTIPAHLGNGTLAVLIWSEFKRLSVRIYSAGLASVSSEILVDIIPGETVYHANIAALKDGKFIVTFSQRGDDITAGAGVYAQMFSQTGDKLSAKFLVNTTVQGVQWYSDAALLTSGDFIVSWIDTLWTQASAQILDHRIKAQVYTMAGEKKGGEIVLETVLKLIDGNTIAALPNGGFVIRWNEYSGLQSDPATIGTGQMKVFTPA